MSVAISNLKNRIKINSDNFKIHSDSGSSLSTLQSRLNMRGGPDQWIRMREDKLYSLKKATLYSYQRAVVQRYDVENNSKADYIIRLITKLRDLVELTDVEKAFLSNIQSQFEIQELRGSAEYIVKLQQIVDNLINASPLFRCLINHDKLKVDYQDKIISIPFEEQPVGSDEVVETNFHNGTVFKWVHGNKEEWTPDTYWIVYMQYSQETAYFRAEIRKADEEIEIIMIDAEGNEHSTMYRGWMTGPNETTILWNVKKNIAWNDMNYTKLLYITKDENTLAFFQRFDRVIINGQPWEIQAYNDNYSVSKSGDVDSGIIRVALKETYTNTDQFVKQTLEQQAENQVDDDSNTEARIEGPTAVFPYSICSFVAKGFVQDYQWALQDEAGLAKIKTISEDGKTCTIQIITGLSSKTGFYIKYGNDVKVHVTITSF